ncbi:AraC family transcriptional regulator [Agriterribacter sp.]|uniref:helix-turn-helix domain-containing protein n=1 Tax=Agriterribacter sp. TaxID=2821509 RepID=UPI002B71D5EF|nr:AraC family transcriptional regulator [Agriterribacter sp.]HRP56276.1 AraC family transcriptional regulator [Agriterribacter sp.]
MVNIYDFITGNSSYFDQLKFGTEDDLFIDYTCPITEMKAKVWSHKNCLMYVMQGAKGYASPEYYHESAKGEILFIRKGGYVLFQRFKEPYRALIFMFGDPAVKSLLAEYSGLLKAGVGTKAEYIDQPGILVLDSSPFIESIFLSSNAYLKQPGPGSNILLSLKFRELLVNLLREKKPNAFYTYLSWLNNDKDISFIKLVRENGGTNFTSGELAKTAGMSLSTFKRIFKKHFGISPGKWLHEQRIARAKRMLKDPEVNISDIAFNLGYSDVAAFSKAFKLETGISPTAFLKPA